MTNSILEEIWRIRREIEKENSGDLNKVFKAMKKRTHSSRRKRHGPALAKKRMAFA